MGWAWFLIGLLSYLTPQNTKSNSLTNLKIICEPKSNNDFFGQKFAQLRTEQIPAHLDFPHP